jgi:hypothetical protein
MMWLALRITAGAAVVAAALYGAYIDGQREKARKQRLQHHHSR